jgi:hypothetical protein
MRRILTNLAVMLAAAAAVTVPLIAADPPKTPAAPRTGRELSQFFMRQKLAYSQGILEGLVLEKFDLVSTNATLLRNMNLTNAFFTLGNPTYKAEIAAFQTAVDNLSKSAKNAEIWPAYEAYNQVAQRCVHCHQQFRREQFLKHTQDENQK